MPLDLHSTLIKYKVTAEQLGRKSYLNLHSTLIKYKEMEHLDTVVLLGKIYIPL